MSAPSGEQRYRDERHSSRQGWWIAAVIVLVVGVAAAIAIPLSLRPRTARAARREVIAVVTSRGQAVAPPSAQMDVHTTVTAPVKRVDATVGQRVSRGEALVDFYYPSVEQARQDALARLEAAQRDYAQARQTYGSQLDAARKQLADAQAEVRQARQAVAQAAPGPETPPSGTPETSPSAATLGHGGRVELVQAGSASQAPATSPDLDKALADEQQAELAVAQAKVDLDQALAPYQQQLDQANAAVQLANQGGQQASVTAPIAGTVLELNAQPGQPVTSSQQQQQGIAPLLARIVDLQALQVQAPISASQASTMKPGLPATLTFSDLSGQRYQGRVSRVVTQSQPGGSGPQYLALIDFSNANGAVKPDMAADVSIEMGRVQDALTVPNGAVRTDQEGRTYVEVQRGGGWQRQDVTTGLRGNQYTEIISGLQDGDIVRV